MLALLAVFAAGSMLLPPVVARLGRRAFLAAALVPGAAFVHASLAAPGIVAGAELRESLPWIPQIGVTLGVRLDTLSLVLALIVSGVGALVLVYCARYFERDEAALGRFAGTLLGFAGAMYGLVVADDVYLLFVFWEATSVFSYLLIAHHTERRASRGAALQALLVTTLGGLAMLVGLVLLAVGVGTSSLAAIVAARPDGPLYTTAIMLVLVGALSKSALVPFHFWLPAAMAAPTPVSAYLHAAAMVKAGVYVIARLAPGFAETDGWRGVLITAGLFTLLLGGFRALRQNDLKLLLAYGTVSQLGLLTVIAGYGTRDAALAALALLLAHALFKAALFLVVGVVDRRAGTRDLRKISGLGRAEPVLAALAVLAALSMAGLPPTLGFVAKEAALTALLEAAADGGTTALFALLGTALGSALTVAYSARLLWGAFGRKRGVDEVRAGSAGALLLASPAVLAIAGVAAAAVVPVLDRGLAGYADTFVGGDYHLALWHGPEPALGISALSVVAGLGIFAARGGLAVWRPRFRWRLGGEGAYWQALRGIDRLAAWLTAGTQRGSLPFYLGVILLVLIGSLATVLALGGPWPAALRPWDHPAQLAIALVMAIAAVAVTRAEKRFQAVVLVGVTGIGMSALFALHGAPDLALTQILVETVTLVAFVLVLRRLPARLGERHASVRRGLRALLGASVGVTMALVALVSLGARVAEPISLEFPRLAYDGGHGRNVVNVALVDLRGWDTMGELSVVIVAATGVASLIFISRRTDTLPRVTRRDAEQTIRERRRRAAEAAEGEQRRSSWLLAGRTLAPRNRSILLEVVVRLLFHAMIVVSVYLLFAGHNAPGGGFAAGLVAGLALVARYLAAGRYELAAAAPVDAGKLLGSGLVLAAGTALVPLFLGADALTSTWFEAELPLLGHVEFVTSTVFDAGVYLVVVGLALDVLRSLGAEIDRQQERDLEGAAP